MRICSADFLRNASVVLAALSACCVFAADAGPASAVGRIRQSQERRHSRRSRSRTSPATRRRGRRRNRVAAFPLRFQQTQSCRPSGSLGDSTVRNGTAGDGGNGQWGWGAPLVAFFDSAKINLVNRAAGGTSARSFYTGNWKSMAELIKRGDVVIMQFGTNDGGQPASSVGELRG